MRPRERERVSSVRLTACRGSGVRSKVHRDDVGDRNHSVMVRFLQHRCAHDHGHSQSNLLMRESRGRIESGIARRNLGEGLPVHGALEVTSCRY